MSTVLAHLVHITQHASALENCVGWTVRQWCECSRAEGKSLKMSVIKAFNSLKPTGWMVTKTQVSDIRLWPCSKCGQVEQSAQALSVHAARAHGMKIDVRRYARTSRCEACLCDFHSRYRLITHLAYRASACVDVLRATVEPLSVEESEDLDFLDRGGHRELLAASRRITFAEKVYVQTHGPMPELSFGDDGYTLGAAALDHFKPVWRRCDQKTSLPKMPAVDGCMAGYYNACSVSCCICRGVRV